MERYKEHLKILYRAKEILAIEPESDEEELINNIMLEEIGCDSLTYGDVWEGDGITRGIKLDTKQKHNWSLDAEIRSFKHALEIMNND